MLTGFFKWNGRLAAVLIVASILVVLVTGPGPIPWVKIIVIVGIVALAGLVTGVFVRLFVPLEARLNAAEALNPKRGKALRKKLTNGTAGADDEDSNGHATQ